MSQVTYEIENHDDLSKGVWLSLALHFFILLFFGVKTAFFSKPDFDYQSAVRVDLVGLPDKVNPNQMPPTTDENTPEAKSKPAEESKPEPTKEVKAEPVKEKVKPEKSLPKLVKKDDSINLEKTSVKEKKAFDSLKKLEALEKIKSDLAKESAQKKLSELAAASKAKAGSAKIKGNMIAHGSDLVGIEKLQHDEYRSVLDRHIKQNWILPEWIGKKKLKAQALVRIDNRGLVISKQIVKTSGNRDFDESVLDTIDRSSPMPAPPDKFVSLVGGDGILIEFGE